MSGRAIVAIFVLLLPAAAAAKGKTSVVPINVRQVSLYVDVKARSVGDIVTVAVVERASASNSSKLSTNKSTKFVGSGGDADGVFSFIPDLSFDAELGRNHSGSGQLTREGRLTASIAATVMEIKPNGDLVISGEREIGINEETEILSVTGTVRPEDISPENVVYSTKIADAKIMYKGKGAVTQGSRPNIFVRVFSWIF